MSELGLTPVWISIISCQFDVGEMPGVMQVLDGYHSCETNEHGDGDANLGILSGQIGMLLT